MIHDERAAAGVSDPLADPDRLRHDWMSLRERHPHLHGPDAAARLGVPEAALVASRIGDGAEPLQLPLAPVLEGSDTWGKVLFAARNRMGVALGILDDASARRDGSSFELHAESASHEVRVRAELDAARFAFLFEDRDAHGHTVSLNWFDGAGDAIGRLFLMSKDGRERALPTIRRHVAEAPRQPWRPQPDALPPVTRLADPIARVRSLAGSPIAIGECAVMGRTAAARWSIVCEGAGVALGYRGPLAHASRTGPAVHATDAACKLHLRLAAAITADVHETMDLGPRLVLSDADGGTLSIAPLADAASVDRWIDALQEASR